MISLRIDAELLAKIDAKAQRLRTSRTSLLIAGALALDPTSTPALPVPMQPIDPGTTERRPGPKPPPFQRMEPRLKPTKKGTP